MKPADLIAAALADGVALTLKDGSLSAEGDGAAVERWLPMLRTRKAELLATLHKGADDRKSWGWLMHFADREPLPIFAVPEFTHAEVLARFPDAIAAGRLASVEEVPT